MRHGRSTLGKDKFHGIQAKNQGLEQRIEELEAALRTVASSKSLFDARNTAVQALQETA